MESRLELIRFLEMLVLRVQQTDHNDHVRVHDNSAGRHLFEPRRSVDRHRRRMLLRRDFRRDVQGDDVSNSS